MKILIVAYACEPNKTSEPGVGWNFSKTISKEYRTTVLTRSNNRDNIESSGDTDIDFIYYDLPGFYNKLKKTLPLGTQFYYLLWQIGAYLHVRHLLKKNKIEVDLLHHLTFGIGWITPPFFLLNKPFVWGPIGGGDFVPFKFLKLMGIKSTIQETIYFTVNKLSKLSLSLRYAVKNAKAIIFRTRSSVGSFASIEKVKVHVISETAMNPRNDFESIVEIKDNFVYAICVGRMTYWKGYLLAVKGFHSFIKNGGKGKLELYGNGPDYTVIKRYIEDNNLGEFIFLKGSVSNQTIHRVMLAANVLLHPSFRDGGSWSVMEAMSHGLCTICLNTSGPKDMVTGSCGFLIDLKSPNQVVTDIGFALSSISDNINLFNSKANSSHNRINNYYSWEKRREQIKFIYNGVKNET